MSQQRDESAARVALYGGSSHRNGDRALEKMISGVGREASPADQLHHFLHGSLAFCGIAPLD